MDSKKIALNALSTGIVAGVASSLLFGNFDVEYFGMPMSSAVALGAGCAVGSVVSDLASEMAIKKLGLNAQQSNASVLATQLGIGAVASSTVLLFGGASTDNLMLSMSLGAGSLLGGRYVYDKVFDPRTGFMPF